MARAVEILLYVPNLIGYGRVILLILTYWCMIDHYILAVTFYSISSILDAFDGLAARMLNQSSKFGALLDMLTDRAATTCLIMCLCHFYPKYMFLFQLWVFLDITSHWAHQLASVIRGENSHKSKQNDAKRHFILRLYYTSRFFLFTLCAMTEVFFCSLYALNFTPGFKILSFLGIKAGFFKILLIVSTPFMLLKTSISLIHLLDACWSLACIESECVKENYTLLDRENSSSSSTGDASKKSS